MTSSCPGRGRRRPGGSRQCRGVDLRPRPGERIRRTRVRGVNRFLDPARSRGRRGRLAGAAVDRWSVSRSWIVLAALLAASTALLGAFPGTLAVAFGCAAVFGGSYVALSGVLIVWGRELQATSPAGATAILFIALAAGQAIGSLGLGSIADAAGSPTAFAAAATAALLSCIGLLSRPTTSKHPHARPASPCSVP